MSRVTNAIIVGGVVYTKVAQSEERGCDGCDLCRDDMRDVCEHIDCTGVIYKTHNGGFDMCLKINGDIYEQAAKVDRCEGCDLRRTDACKLVSCNDWIWKRVERKQTKGRQNV